MCKMMTSPDAIFKFSKFWFSGLLEGWKSKKEQKILSVSRRISGTVPHMIAVLGTHVLNDDISSNFFSLFQNSGFWGF